VWLTVDFIESASAISDNLQQRLETNAKFYERLAHIAYGDKISVSSLPTRLYTKATIVVH
jgi:predicted DNA-binding ribbon-helix-helix protein